MGVSSPCCVCTLTANLTSTAGAGGHNHTAHTDITAVVAGWGGDIPIAHMA